MEMTKPRLNFSTGLLESGMCLQSHYPQYLIYSFFSLPVFHKSENKSEAGADNQRISYCSGGKKQKNFHPIQRLPQVSPVE